MIRSRKATFSWDSLLLGALPQQGMGDLSCLGRYFCCSAREVHLGTQSWHQAGQSSWEGSGGIPGKALPGGQVPGMLGGRRDVLCGIKAVSSLQLLG